MIDKRFAQPFAEEWIDAWNAHDLPRILSHYADDVEMSSPVVVQITGETSGALKGKALVGEYWRRALERAPDLYFRLRTVLVGVNSITLYYAGVRGLSAEVFFFNADRQVVKAVAHYVVSVN